MDKTGKNNIGIRVDDFLFTQLHEQAKRRGQTLSAYIKHILYEEVKKEAGK